MDQVIPGHSLDRRATVAEVEFTAVEVKATTRLDRSLQVCCTGSSIGSVANNSVIWKKMLLSPAAYNFHAVR